MKLVLAMVLKLIKSSLYNTVLQSFHNTLYYMAKHMSDPVSIKRTLNLCCYTYTCGWLTKMIFLKFYLKYIHCTSPHEKYMYTFKIIINTV